MSAPKFVTVSVAHDADCGGCRECVKAAEIHASVTGSTGATYTNDASRTTGEVHSAVVTRSCLLRADGTFMTWSEYERANPL